MALEAARQLSSNRDSDHDSIRISNIRFEQLLPLSTFTEANTAVETQLLARQIEGTNQFAFEIFSQMLADEGSWTRHCSGNFESQANVQPCVPNSQKLLHDQILLEKARAAAHNVGIGLSNLKLSLEGSSGEFERGSDSIETYAVHPSMLDYILALPPMSLLDQNLPAEYRLSSIDSITAPVLRLASDCGNFATRIKSSTHYNVESDVEINQYEGVTSLKGLKHEATKVIHQKPALNSLFFKQVLLPDVTTPLTAASISISRCIELMTHKWPMCDVKIDNVPEQYTVSIMEALGAAGGQTRSYFRSVKCSSIPPNFVSNRIQMIDGSDLTSRFHMVITQDVPPAVNLSDQLYSRGLLCMPKANMQKLGANQSASLEVVSEVTGLGSEQWVLLRKATAPGPTFAGRRVVVFTSQDGAPSLNGLEEMESVPLEPTAVDDFCKQNGFAKFDAIIVDHPGKSVITTWTGGVFMPWVQNLLKSADSILWVTHDGRKSPFTKVAGSLLRTLQSEQPSLKVHWLVIDEVANNHLDTFASQVERTFTRMLEGEDELVTRKGEVGLEILRYLPDDDLSADTGLRLPRRVQSPLGEAEYSLHFAAPGEPVILSHKASPMESLGGETVTVLVGASVLDTIDLQSSNGKANNNVCVPHSGSSFAGRVLNGQGSDIAPGSLVVGWHPNHSYRKKVSVQSYSVLRYPSEMQPSHAASRYASIVAASCIVDGIARARQGETFLFEFQGPLLHAAKQVCKRLGASVLTSCPGSKADFVVTFRCPRGICVNDEPIDLASYLRSDHSRAMIWRIWQEPVEPPLQIREYEIADYREALKSAKQPYSTVLLHHNAAKIVDHVPMYKKAASMFKKDANYILIGGLGGLGRFICSWMIENGAKHITAISRSGTGTAEARDAVSALSASGASIQCIKADACDRKAVSEILSKLRNERSIKGVINLAMVLAEGPMATMAGDDWDRGLRVKIDSSWILHEETLQDRLDFFILFSSIASVLGNRSQGNYNVANGFLNALAEYRQSMDLPGISVALGAMSKSSDRLSFAHDRSRSPLNLLK